MTRQKRRIVIPCCKTFEFVYLDDIIRFEGLQNYTRVFLKNGEVLVSSNNLGKFKNELAELGFFCCHKSHLINEDYLLRYHKEGYIEMMDLASVPLSRRKKEEFFQRIDGMGIRSSGPTLISPDASLVSLRPSMGISLDSARI